MVLSKNAGDADEANEETEVDGLLRLVLTLLVGFKEVIWHARRMESLLVRPGASIFDLRPTQRPRRSVASDAKRCSAIGLLCFRAFSEAFGAISGLVMAGLGAKTDCGAIFWPKPCV